LQDVCLGFGSVTLRWLESFMTSWSVCGIGGRVPTTQVLGFGTLGQLPPFRITHAIRLARMLRSYLLHSIIRSQLKMTSSIQFALSALITTSLFHSFYSTHCRYYYLIVKSETLLSGGLTGRVTRGATEYRNQDNAEW